MFSVRQSSSIRPALEPGRDSCGQSAPNAVASRMPSHDSAGFGRPPAPRADRRRGERDAFVDANALARAQEQAALGADDAEILSLLQGGQVVHSAACCFSAGRTATRSCSA